MERNHIPLKLQALIEGARVKKVIKGQTILYQSDVPYEVFIIKTGTIKLYNIDEQGSEKVLHLLIAPMIMPLSFFSGDHTTVRWFYGALTECELYVLPMTTLSGLMRSDGDIATYLINTFSKEIHEILTRLESLGKSNVYTKLVAALNYLVLCHGERVNLSWWRIPFPVNHQLMADMTGVTRETASAAMKKLSDHGIVRNPSLARLEINSQKLAAFRARHSFSR